MSTPEEMMVSSERAAVRRFLIEDQRTYGWKPQCDGWLRSFDLGFSRRLGAQGWVGSTWPTRYAGAGRSYMERLAVTEELLFAGAPVAAHWISDRQIGPALLHHGTEEQRLEFLPRIVTCDVMFCVGLSEPDTGSDLASLSLRADRVSGGWQLTGSKIWVSYAHRAHYGYILARTSTDADRHAGLTEFIVDLAQPAVTIRPIVEMSGEHHFNEVILEEAFVPDRHVVGAVGEGWSQITSQLAYERSGPERILSTAPLLSGLMDRQQPEDGAGAAAVGDLTARTWVLRRLARQVAEGLDGGSPPVGLAALVKLFGTELERDVVEVAGTRFGIEAAPDVDGLAGTVAFASYAAPTFTLRGGANEILTGIVAKELAR